MAYFKPQTVRAANVDSESATDGWRLTADGVGGAAWEAAAGGCTDITYANLVTAIGASTLTPGGFYRITDFATKHYIVDADGTQYTTGDGIVTGTVEPLIILAVAANKLSGQVYSQTYPQDIIYYDWDSANWLTDLSFATGGVIISGWKGIIIYRRDTIYDNYAPGDWRNCLTRRWKTAATAWDAGTNYVAGNIVSHAGTAMVYKALQASLNQIPAGESDNYWVVMLDLGTYEYWNVSPTEWHSIPSGAAYDDFTLFNGAQPRAIHIEPFLDNSVLVWLYQTLLCNSVFWNASADNGCAIESGFYFNTMDGPLYSNILGACFSGNTVGPYFVYNIIGATFQKNHLRSNFASNMVGANSNNNVIGENCTSNNIGAGFGSLFLGGNVISIGCNGNTIDASFMNNIAGVDFQDNNIDTAAIANTNFIGATHVYQTYNCELYIDSVLGPRLMYRANDVLTFAAPTA